MTCALVERPRYFSYCTVYHPIRFFSDILLYDRDASFIAFKHHLHQHECSTHLYTIQGVSSWLLENSPWQLFLLNTSNGNERILRTIRRSDDYHSASYDNFLHRNEMRRTRRVLQRITARLREKNFKTIQNARNMRKRAAAAKAAGKMTENQRAPPIYSTRQQAVCGASPPPSYEDALLDEYYYECLPSSSRYSQL
ncbi:hypothetical protein Angca_001562, partial [Angiostrongylus cantonensis]